MLVASGDAVNNLLEGAVVNVEGNTGDTSGGREGSEVGVDLGLGVADVAGELEGNAGGRLEGDVLLEGLANVVNVRGGAGLVGTNDNGAVNKGDLDEGEDE